MNAPLYDEYVFRGQRCVARAQHAESWARAINRHVRAPHRPLDRRELVEVEVLTPTGGVIRRYDEDAVTFRAEARRTGIHLTQSRPCGPYTAIR